MVVLVTAGGAARAVVVLLVLFVAGALITPGGDAQPRQGIEIGGPGDQVDGLAGIGGDLQVFGGAGIIDRGVAGAGPAGR